MKKIIMHVDMNAFFASVEQRVNPALRGRPVAVVGAGKRTVVTTASYEARRFGVKTGMNIYEAKSSCPSLIIVRGDNRKYIDASTRVMEILKGFSPLVEPCSIDEAFVDLGAVTHEEAKDVALSVKKSIHASMGLFCSIGIAPNKLLAKLASDMEKPDGLVLIKDEDVFSVLEDMPVERLFGIGKKTAIALNSMGIKTCGELSRFSSGLLRQRFGITGERLKSSASGIDEGNVQADSGAPKSIGHSVTLPQDVRAGDVLKAYMLKLSDMVGRRARENKLKGAKVCLVLRYTDFRTFTRQKTLLLPTNDTHAIYHASCGILASIRLESPVRLVGVTLDGLAGTENPGLFEDMRKREKALSAMDGLNSRFGDSTVFWATLKSGSEIQACRVIPPSWRPVGARKFDVR